MQLLSSLGRLNLFQLLPEYKLQKSTNQGRIQITYLKKLVYQQLTV